MSSAMVLKLSVFTTTAVLFCGCSDGIRQHIRDKDFRAGRVAETANLPPPSPIANVADMPGWTTDVDGAMAFARDNGRKTVVFVQAGQSPQSRTMKQALTSQKTTDALGSAEKVTFDATTSPELAARYGVRPPAVVVLDNTGAAIGQQQGTLNLGALAASVR